MAFKVFLDANVLLDFTLKRPGFDDVKEVISKSMDGKLLLYTSTSVLHITAYWLTKGYNDKLAKEVLTALLDEVQVIDCSHHIVLLAIHSSITDIEDAIQYYTALHHNIAYFISADKQLKKSAIHQLPVLTASELLEELE